MACGLQLALSIQPLRCAREGYGAVEAGDREVLCHVHLGFIKSNLTTVADVLFEQKPDIQPQDVSVFIQMLFSANVR